MIFEKPLRTLASLLPTFARSSTTTAMTMSSSSTTCSAAPAAAVKVVPNDKLYVSEPDPRWFGNDANPKNHHNKAWTNANWLKSRFHFSFAEYSNYHNSNFGVLRVMNDDLVQPDRGFGTHPHANMEIVTYIVHGQLTHQDSMGTKETLGRGSVQFMTAGTGVRHSEFNHATDQPLRFIQTWIVPRQSNLPPNYGSYRGDDQQAQRKNKLQHLVADVKGKSTTAPVEINQDVNAHVTELDLGQSVVHELPAGRQAYLLCVEGGVKINGQALQRHDACEIQGQAASPTTVEIEATQVEETEGGGKVAHVLLFEMKQTAGSGRKDL